MCLAFVLYYPRSRLADCRSLPSASSFLSALGVERVRGSAFQRLAEFLGDIGQQVISLMVTFIFKKKLF